LARAHKTLKIMGIWPMQAIKQKATPNGNHPTWKRRCDRNLTLSQWCVNYHQWSYVGDISFHIIERVRFLPPFLFNASWIKIIQYSITASNIKNIKFEIRNNKLDQLQGMSANMAASGIRAHARTNQWHTLESRSYTVQYSSKRKTKHSLCSGD